MSFPQDSPPLEDDGDEIIIPINRTFTDGDRSTWPTEPRWGMPEDDYYRRKLAEAWLKETGAYEPGKKYIIDSLPEGYGLFDRPRGTNPTIRDRFLFGHPAGYFQSTITFFPHFYHLMTGGTQPCNCQPCSRREKKAKYGTPGAKRMGRPPGRPSGGAVVRPVGRRPGRPGRPPGSSSARAILDREGTPDVFKTAIIQLKNSGTIDQPITEPNSMDWRAERTGLEAHLERISLQPSFVPRAGEIVLWTPEFDGELSWSAEHHCVGIFSQGEWQGRPSWRAGVVSQIPEEETVLQDIADTDTPSKSWEVNYSGFRVETFPDPNSDDKSYSLHYKYVYLKCMKPFNAYEHFLQGLPREEMHPSIEYALTIMSSFSLLDKYHIKGVWPDASVFCKGIFIGAELLLVGDAVRLKPWEYEYSPEDAYRAIMDVMVVEEIRLQLKQCDDDPRSPQLAERYEVRISGKVYTKNHRRVQRASKDPSVTPEPLKPDEVVDAFQSIGMSGYGNWYRMWEGRTVEVSQGMVIGRCYEPDAMHLMFSSLHLGLDLTGVLKGREYSRAVDARIPEGKDWFWGDFRTQTLAIDTLNGEDVGHFSETRDVKMWRANLRVIDGNANPADLRDAKIPGELGRPSTKARSDFSAVGKISKLVSTGLGGTDASNPVSSEEGNSGLKEEEEEGDSFESVETEEEKVYVARIDQLRGGTEETEEGDYTPGSEPHKRPKYE